MVELFSGSGAVAAEFAANGWRCATIDMDAGRPASIVGDVGRLPLAPAASGARAVEFLWGSPPCTEFSTAAAGRPRLERRPSLELIFATLRAVAWLRPRFWILENVVGAIPYIGVPAQKVGPWCLWGYFPLLAVDVAMQTHRKGAATTAARRAAIPADLAAAVRRAVERGLSVPSVLDLRPLRLARVRVPAGAEAQAPLFPEAEGGDPSAAGTARPLAVSGSIA